MRVGAVAFDLENFVAARDGNLLSLDRGWACIAGETPRRIQSAHDLASDVVWFTNLSYGQTQQARLHQDPKFRNSGWLRTSFQQLASELCVDGENAPPDVTAFVIAEVAQRVVTMASRDYGVAPQSRYSLNEDFARTFMAPRSTIIEEFYDDCFRPIAEHVKVEVIHTQNVVASGPSVTFRANRLRHARDLLNTPVPLDTGWRRASPSEATEGWLNSLDTPFLVKCTITDALPRIAEVLSWGSGATSRRDWLTDLEWRMVRELANVRITGALICAEPARRLPQADRLPSGPQCDLSLTAGLVAEQMWTGMAAKLLHHGIERRYTAAAAWLRAAERMRMFQYAQALAAQGLCITLYGVGNVVVRYPEGGLAHVIEIASRAGLLPPASKVAQARKAAA